MVIKVLPDANVFWSRTLRDWLLLLKLRSGGSMFTVHSTEDILAETLYRLRRSHPAWDGGTIATLRQRLEQSVDSIISDYQIDGSFPGTDTHDQHVHAAATDSHMDIVLTFDSGFTGMSPETLDRLEYEVCTPDHLFLLIDDSAPDVTDAVLREQVAYYKDRPGARSLSEAMRRAGCPAFAERLDGR